jgi:hypothetical protein
MTFNLFQPDDALGHNTLPTRFTATMFTICSELWTWVPLSALLELYLLLESRLL